MLQSSNPGWNFFTYLFVVKCVFEKTKINEKEAGVGPFLRKVQCIYLLHFKRSPVHRLVPQTDRNDFRRRCSVTAQSPPDW